MKSPWLPDTSADAYTLPLFASLTLGEDKPDFTGKWELVIERSDFGNVPKPARMTIQSSVQSGAMHSIQTTYTDQDSESTEYLWYLDGKRHPTDKPVPGYSETHREDTTLVSERASNDGAYRETSRLTLSRDGKTATEVVQVRSPEGTNKEKLVWRKIGT